MNFKDMRPSWEIGRSFRSVEDLRNLGCSERLIEYLDRPNLRRDGFLIEPEEWFWYDWSDYNHIPPHILTEVRSIAGGAFVDLSLESQCRLLDIPLRTMSGKRVAGSRGKWAAKSGPVSVEDYVLYNLCGSGSNGFAREGKPVAALFAFAYKIYQRITGKIFGYTKTPKGLVWTGTDGTWCEDMQVALREARYGMADEYRSNPKFYDAVLKGISIDEITSYIDIVGWNFIEKIHHISCAFRGMVMRGWPDITYRSHDLLKFVEVKSRDKLRGAQARWICDTARTLGLDVSVVRVTED